MKHLIRWISLLPLVMGLLPITLHAAPLDRSRGGYVEKIDGRSLELCFRQGPRPAVGDTLAIVREWIPFSKGTPASPRYLTVAHARVTGISQAPCVTAETLDGTPQRYNRAQSASDESSLHPGNTNDDPPIDDRRH